MERVHRTKGESGRCKFKERIVLTIFAFAMPAAAAARRGGILSRKFAYVNNEFV